MAKVTFSKLKLTSKKENFETITWNEQVIEVKQYVPIEQKLEIISNAINKSSDGNNFANPIKLEVFMHLELLYHYTNISFTDKIKEDEVKLYDLCKGSGLIAAVIDKIPSSEYEQLCSGVFDCAEAVYKYRNSILGLLETISNNEEKLRFDAEELYQQLLGGDTEFLKEVLSKLG